MALIAAFVRRTGRGLALLLACGLVALTLFEIWLRATGQRPHRQEIAGRFLFESSTFFEFRPYMNFGEHPLSGAYPFIQSRRGPLAKGATGAYRILVFGGSVVRAMATHRVNGIRRVSPRFDPPGEWWAHLEDLLNARRPPELADVRFQVRSAGGSAYTTTNEVIKLVLMDIADYAPDLIVFLDGYNDLYNAIAFRTPPGVDLIASGLETRARHPVAYALYRLTSTWLWSVARLAEAVLVRDLRSRVATDPDPAAIADRLLRNYRAARTAAEGMGASFAVVLQPFAILHHKPAGTAAGDPRFWATHLADGYRETLALTRAGLARDGIRTLDFTRLFDRPGGPAAAAFYDAVHFYDIGYAFLAASLVEELGAWIFSETATSTDPTRARTSRPAPR